MRITVPFRSVRPVALLCLVAAGPLSAGCASRHDSRLTVRATQGVVVQAGIDEVWAAVQETLPGAPSAGAPMSARATVGGATVEVRVERYDDARTILHVTSPDPSAAEDVQLAIQGRLLR